MKKQQQAPTSKQGEKRNEDLPGYPIYPAKEDIYNQAKEESEIDPEDPDRKKIPNDSTEAMNELDFTQDVSGSDLDIPGSELDDDQEAIGSEDEENNHYSIGGDNHEDLEESRE